MSRTPPVRLPVWSLLLALAGCGGGPQVRDDAPPAPGVAYDQTAVLGSVVDFGDPAGEPVILPAVVPETPQVAVLDPHQLPAEPLPEPAPAPAPQPVDVPKPLATVSIVPPAPVPLPEPEAVASAPAPVPQPASFTPAPVADAFAGVESSEAFAPIPTEPAGDEPVALPPPSFPAAAPAPAPRSSRSAKAAKPVTPPAAPAAALAPLVATAAPTVAAAVAEVVPTPAPAPVEAKPVVVEPTPVPVPMPEPTAVAEVAPEPQPMPVSAPVPAPVPAAPAPEMAALVPADAVAFQPLSTEPENLDEPLPPPMAAKPVPRPVITRPAPKAAEPMVTKPAEVVAAAPAPVVEPTPAPVTPAPVAVAQPEPAPVMVAQPTPQPEPAPVYTPAPTPAPEVVAPVAAAVAAAASSATALVAAPVTEAPPAPPVDTSPVSITDEALKYLDDAFNQIQATALYRDRVDWLAARSRMLDAARHAQTPADTYDALRALLAELKEDLAVFHPPAAAPAAGPRAALPTAQQFGLKSTYFDGIATLVVPSVDGDESIGSRYATLLNEMIGSLDARDTCGWIVDLRGLDGGDIQAPLVGLGPLFGEGVSGYFSYPDGRQTPYGYWRGEARGVTGSKARSYRPVALKQANPPIAVIVGPRTAYAGEAIALAFHRRANVVTVGSATAGRAVAARSFMLSDGATLSVTMARLADRLGKPQVGPIKPELEVGVAKVRGPILEGDVAASLARSSLRSSGCRP